MVKNNIILSAAVWAARWLPMPVKKGIYQIPGLAVTLRKSLNLAAPNEPIVVDVAGGSLAGAKFRLDLQREKDYWLGTYEPELQTAITQFIQPGMVVYDVGANIGYITTLLARTTGENGKVYAFEALPENLNRLNENLALNALAEQVSVISAAIIDQDRRVRFFLGPSGGMGKAEGSAGRQDYPYSGDIEVEGISLDSFVYLHNNSKPDAIKIDIEGGEVLALHGMQRLLSEARPLIFMEIHGPQAAETAWMGLKATGYRICRMEHSYPLIEEWRRLDWKSYLVCFPIKELEL